MHYKTCLILNSKRNTGPQLGTTGTQLFYCSIIVEDGSISYTNFRSKMNYLVNYCICVGRTDQKLLGGPGGTKEFVSFMIEHLTSWQNGCNKEWLKAWPSSLYRLCWQDRSYTVSQWFSILLSAPQMGWGLGSPEMSKCWRKNTDK